jgi:dihydrofolate synthase/folylpolyglutamate synthase
MGSNIIPSPPHDIIAPVNYREAIDYILSFTDFEKLPGSAYAAANFDLRRMEELLDRMGNPHLASLSVHVAGTKGKGSTAAMMASALSAAGHRTGLYTSPHLHTFRERVTIDGRMVPEDEFAGIVKRLRPNVDEINRRHEYGELTTFEILTALAFAFFAERVADYQVLETGLGGRLDATNVVRPELCVITSISMDHAEVLGDTLTQIAKEKAGIIKPGAVVVSAPQAAEAAEVIRHVCRDQGARLIEAGRDVTWRKLGTDLSGQSLEVKTSDGSYRVNIPLLGAHQLENAATAVAALEVLGVSDEHIASGLASVEWPGRLEILQQEPLVLIDGAHNSESARKLGEALSEHFDYDRLILIIGSSSDKDIAGMIDELASLAHVVIATRSRHPRAMATDSLLEALSKDGITGIKAESVSVAIDKALDIAGPNDLVCATGSLFVAAEAREHVKGIPTDIVS